MFFIYLLEVLDIIKNRSLEKKVLSSTDFLADMILNNESLFRYYSIQKKDWYGESGLSDYALLAKLFQQAFTKYRFERYQKAASKVLRISLKQYYDSEKNIFIDPQLDAKDYEYLMGINADFALAIMAESKNNLGKINKMVEPMIGYFSGLEELLEERIWDGKDWDLLERYALFLSAAETYLDFKMNPQN